MAVEFPFFCLFDASNAIYKDFVTKFIVCFSFFFLARVCVFVVHIASEEYIFIDS